MHATATEKTQNFQGANDMNGAWKEAKTPNERLAVILKDYLRELEDSPDREGKGILPATNVGSTDLAEYMEPFTQREELLARIKEARVLLGMEAARVAELTKQLFETERRIPTKFRLYP